MKWVQRKGYRVNLRYLAERQTLGWLVVIWFTAWGFCRLCQLLGSIDTGSPRQHAPISFAGQRQYVQHRTAEKYAGSDLDSRNSMPSIFDDF